jgi:hypothetical protein
MIIPYRAKRKMIDIMMKYMFVYDFFLLNYRGVFNFAFGSVEQITSQAVSSQSNHFDFQFIKGEF